MTNSFKSNITSEEVQLLPHRQFGGRIVLVDNQSRLKEALPLLHANTLLGFDTETKPSFKKGQNHKVCLLQIASDTTCFIFRLNKIGFCEELVHLLSQPSVVKIGLSLKDDFRELSKLGHFHPAGFVELQQYVEQFAIADKSLKKLAGIVLGCRISKTMQTSNWEAEMLSPQQLVYAATDAWICLEIYKKLHEVERLQSNRQH